MVRCCWPGRNAKLLHGRCSKVWRRKRSLIAPAHATLTPQPAQQRAGGALAAAATPASAGGSGAMQDQLRATKLWLQKQFKTSGIQLDPAALEELVRAVQDVPDPAEFVDSLIDEIETGAPGWGGARRRHRRSHRQAAAGGGSSGAPCQG